MKILLICSNSQNVYNFRVPLIKHLVDNGFDVYTAGFDNAYSKQLSNLGVKYHSFDGRYKSANILENFKTLIQYKKFIKIVKPDLLFTFMPKPNTLGVLAGMSCGIKHIYCMVEGAGDAFGQNSLKWRLIKIFEVILYKRCFKLAEKIFFLNHDDLDEFITLRIVNSNKCVLINGIGVDLNRFIQTSFDLNSNAFLMVTRLMKTKGIFDFIHCAEIVKRTIPEACFYLAGPEGDISVNDLKPWIDNETIVYLGFVEDIRPLFSNVICLLHPSYYREGFPMTIMEAEALGRCVITTNNVGCKETIIHGYNGFLCNIHDVESMAEHCINLFNNKKQAFEMGNNARNYAEKFFDVTIINKIICSELLKGIYL